MGWWSESECERGVLAVSRGRARGVCTMGCSLRTHDDTSRCLPTLDIDGVRYLDRFSV